MKIDIDKLLKETMDESAKENYKKVKKDPRKHIFSFRFRFKMKKLINSIEVKEESGNKSKIKFYTSRHSLRRSIALVILVAALAGGTVMGATLIRWLYNQYIEQFTDHVEIKNAKEAVSTDTGEFQKYELGYLPEGYELVSEEYDEMFQTYERTYKKEEQTLFIQQTIADKEANVTSDGRMIEEIKWGEFKGYYVPDTDYASVIVSDSNYIIIMGGNEKSKEFQKIIENLK